MFIKLENNEPVGYAVTFSNLQSLFPDITFPHIIIPECVKDLGFGMYEWTQVPDVKYPYKLVEVTPTLRDNNIYYQTWSIQEMTDAEKDEAVLQQTAQIRNQRDFLLMMSDWSQFPDAPVDKEAWQTYRQALRDIPLQEGFPFDISYPEKPV